jgi:hypothetical protein
MQEAHRLSLLVDEEGIAEAAFAAEAERLGSEAARASQEAAMQAAWGAQAQEAQREAQGRVEGLAGKVRRRFPPL